MVAVWCETQGTVREPCSGTLGGHNVSVCNSAPMACAANRESFWTINDTTAGGAYVDIAGDTGLDEGVA